MAITILILGLLVGLLPDETTETILHPLPTGDDASQSCKSFRCEDAFGFEMRQIPIQKKTIKALVSDRDFKALAKYKWYRYGEKAVMRYEWRGEKRHSIYMHREIMNTPRGLDTDHRNHNTLDNRRRNLRIATRRENSGNRKPTKRLRLSRYKGVTWRKKEGRMKCGKWRATIGVNYKTVSLGNFMNQKDAARAYNRAAIIQFGRFAYLNKL